ncbi:MAG: hypothetical protein KGS47_14210 [Chloroflexi bacterium]|nr:hypothetical protein [Chloroflexota bacterium]
MPEQPAAAPPPAEPPPVDLEALTDLVEQLWRHDLEAARERMLGSDPDAW